jgi:serine/threonine protein kinase
MHRDLKPANICIGSGKNSNILYLLDFGMAKKIIPSQYSKKG